MSNGTADSHRRLDTVCGVRSAHRLYALNDLAARGHARARLTKQASEFRSEHTAALPLARASTAVVPPPQNGSRMRSPGLVRFAMIARARYGDIRAGYLKKPCVYCFARSPFRAASRSASHDTGICGGGEGHWGISSCTLIGGASLEGYPMPLSYDCRQTR